MSETGNADFETTAQTVRDVIAKDAPWLQPEGESHMISPEMLIALGNVIVMAFASGVAKGGKDAIEEWGKSLAGWLKKRIDSVFKDEPEATKKEEFVEVIRRYEEVVRTTDGKELASIKSETTIRLKAALVANYLPEATAEQAAEAAANL